MPTVSGFIRVFLLKAGRLSRAYDMAARAAIPPVILWPHSDGRGRALMRPKQQKRAPEGALLAARGRVPRYFLAPPRAELRPVPRPRPIFLANSERCAA